MAAPPTTATTDAPAPEVDAGRSPQERARARRLTMVGVGIWLVAFVPYVAVFGVPTSRSLIIAWSLAAVLLSKLGDLRSGVKSMVIDFLPLFAGLALYDALRGRADDLTTVAHVDPQLAFDKAIGFGETPTERLQGAFYHPGHAQWYDFVAWSMHLSHFFLSTALLVVLWRVGSEKFRPLLGGVVLLSYGALLTYWLYPAVPPWMASQQGHHLHPIKRVIERVWGEAGFHRAPKLLIHHGHEAKDIASRPVAPAMAAAHKHKSAFSDPVAALPSLHGAIPMLLLLTLRGIRGWITALLAIYVVLMGVSLVYGGEHYVFDVLLGWCYAAGAWALAAHRVPWRATRQVGRGARRLGRSAASLVTSAR